MSDSRADNLEYTYTYKARKLNEKEVCKVFDYAFSIFKKNIGKDKIFVESTKALEIMKQLKSQNIPVQNFFIAYAGFKAGLKTPSREQVLGVEKAFAKKLGKEMLSAGVNANIINYIRDCF